MGLIIAGLRLGVVIATAVTSSVVLIKVNDMLFDYARKLYNECYPRKEKLEEVVDTPPKHDVQDN